MSESTDKIKGGYRKAKMKAIIRVNKTVDWVKNNPQIALGVGTAVVGTGKYFGKNIIKRGNLRKAEKVKQEYCYDPSLGHYWQLKRKLSNSEWRAVENRKKNGEKLGEIFESMKVLK